MKSFFFSKEKLPPKPKNIELLQSLIGGFVSILFLIGFSQLTHYTFIMAPFGASCVILFAVSQSPLAQPRNVIFGHLIAAFVGLVFLNYLVVLSLLPHQQLLAQSKIHCSQQVLLLLLF